MSKALSMALGCVLLSISGCGSGGSGRAPSSTGQAAPAVRSGSVQIAYRNIMISPAAITVKAGTTVRWTSYGGGGVEHNVTVQSGPEMFSSSSLKAGGIYQFTLTKPGVYSYLCSFHPASMVGKITVVS